MSDDEGWRDVTPTTPGYEYQVQQHQDGRARHRRVEHIPLDQVPGHAINDCGACEYVRLAGNWIRGWPGKGLQW